MAHVELEPLRHMGLLGAGTQAGSAAARPRPGLTELGDLGVEILPLGACEALAREWRDLAARAVEPNVFFEPGFLLAAARHLPEAQDHSAVLVWAREPEGSRLVGFWPMRATGGSWRARRAAGLRCRHIPFGAPLLDRALAVESASAMLKALALGEGGVALFSDMALDGPAARALRAAALISGLSVGELDAQRRPCLWREGAPSSPTGRARRERSRRLRRLARHGEVKASAASTPGEVREAVELFMALEASGWRARSGAALLCRPRDAAFFRCMSRALSREGQIAVHLLQAGSQVAAAGVVLSRGGQSWFLALSHDAQLREAAPGALLGQSVAESFASAARQGESGAGEDSVGAGSDFRLDSCALPARRMFEHAWVGRMRVGVLAVGERPPVDRLCRRSRLRRGLGDAAAALMGRLSFRRAGRAG